MINSAGFEALYTAEQTRLLDKTAIQERGVPGIRLMARAGRACFDILLELWQEPESLQIFCGGGNNGGDGFIIAELAQRRGLPATVYQLGDEQKISGDAALAREQALRSGVTMVPYEAGLDIPAGVVVDAMLGTGLGGAVRGAFLDAVEDINRSGLPVLAVDIPSGLCSDSGAVLGAAVVADATVTFIGLKRGLFTGQAPDYTGAVIFNDLAVPPDIYTQVPTTCHRADLAGCLDWLAPRPVTAHKGSYGRVLVVGGDYGMAGAASLAAEAAARTGAGLVRAATRPEHVAAIVARVPEVMAFPVANGHDLAPLVAQADVLVAGPGLGQSTWSEQLLQVAADAGKPMVLDADGLNLLSAGGIVAQARRDNWVLTPHPGEAARLLGVSNADIQRDRFAAAHRISLQYGGVALLKGAGTLVAAGEEILLSDYGNPGMASGGMGDVLSGIIGGLLAQGLPAVQAATLGAVVHGAAADRAARRGERGLLASDLMKPLRKLLA